jgi:hypothetical protein
MINEGPYYRPLIMETMTANNEWMNEWMNEWLTNIIIYII